MDAKKEELAKLQSALEEVEGINGIFGDLKGEIVTMQTKLGVFEQVWKYVGFPYYLTCEILRIIKSGPQVAADLTELEKHLELATSTEMKAVSLHAL